MFKCILLLLVFWKVAVCLPSASLQDEQQHLERRARIKQTPASTGLYGFQRGSVTSCQCEVSQPSSHAVPICSYAAPSWLPSTSQTKSPNTATAAVAKPHLRILRASSSRRTEDSSRAERAGELEQNEDETETSSEDDLISSSSDSGSNKSCSLESSNSSKASDPAPSYRSSDNPTSRNTMSSGPLESVVPKRTSANAPSGEHLRNLNRRRDRKKSRFESPKESEHRKGLPSPRWIDAGSASRSPALPDKDSRHLTLKLGTKGMRKMRSPNEETEEAKSPSSFNDFIEESSKPAASSRDDTWTSEIGVPSTRRKLIAKMAESDFETHKGKWVPVEFSSVNARPPEKATPDQLSDLESMLRHVGVPPKEFEQHPKEAERVARLFEKFKRYGSNREVLAERKKLLGVARDIYQKAKWRYQSNVKKWRAKHGIPAPKDEKYTREKRREIEKVATKMVDLKRSPGKLSKSWSEAVRKIIQDPLLKGHQRQSFQEQLMLIEAGTPPKILERGPNVRKKERGNASKSSKSSSKAIEGT